MNDGLLFEVSGKCAGALVKVTVTRGWSQALAAVLSSCLCAAVERERRKVTVQIGHRLFESDQTEVR